MKVLLAREEFRPVANSYAVDLASLLFAVSLHSLSLFFIRTNRQLMKAGSDTEIHI